MPIRAQLRGARAPPSPSPCARRDRALAATAAGRAAANPLTFDYDNSTAITAYARPTGAVVVGRNFFNPALVDQIQRGGGRSTSSWTSSTAGGPATPPPATRPPSTGAPENTNWLWSPRRSNWPGTYIDRHAPGIALDPARGRSHQAVVPDHARQGTLPRRRRRAAVDRLLGRDQRDGEVDWVAATATSSTACAWPSARR